VKIAESKQMKRLSVVVPVYNEEESLERLFETLTCVLGNIADLELEVVLVDDGSHDGSWAILERQNKLDPRFCVVRFARNFGHQMAITAGLDCATGDAVAVMDADLQDPPEVILEMVECWRNGADIAYGQRRERKGESLFKLATARGFYKLMHIISRDPTPKNVGDFYLLSRRALERLKSMRERFRYLRGMIFWLGFDPQAVVYDREARQEGETKFSVAKMSLFALDGILSTSSLPLYMSSFLGVLAAIIGLCGFIWAIYTKLTNPAAALGWASTMVAVLFMGGVQLLTIGILGAYIARIYDETKNRPLYVVKEKRGP
jgi:polyisoprenyl-phosphate glycosyltransferase